MKINPNNFYQRELDILPPHFVNTVVKAHEADIEKMRKWIYGDACLSSQFHNILCGNPPEQMRLFRHELGEERRRFGPLNANDMGHAAIDELRF